MGVAVYVVVFEVHDNVKFIAGFVATYGQESGLAGLDGDVLKNEGMIAFF